MSIFDLFRKGKKLRTGLDSQHEPQPRAPGSESVIPIREIAPDVGPRIPAAETAAPAVPAAELSEECPDLAVPSAYEGVEPDVQERLLRLAIHGAEALASRGPRVWASAVRRLYAGSPFSVPVSVEDLLQECGASDPASPILSLSDIRQHLMAVYEQMTWLPYIPDTGDPGAVRREQRFIRSLEEYCRLLVQCVDSDEDRPRKMDRCKAMLEDLRATPGHEADAVLRDLEADFSNRCVCDGIRDFRSAEFTEEQLDSALHEHLTRIAYRDPKRQDAIIPDEKYQYNNYIYHRDRYVRDKSWDVTVEAGTDVRARVIDGSPYLEFGWIKSDRVRVKQQEPVYDLALFPKLKDYVLAATQHTAAVYHCKDGKELWRAEIPYCEEPHAFFTNNGRYMVVNRNAWEIRYHFHYEEKTQ